MRLRRRLYTLLFAALLAGGFVIWQNNDLTLSSYDVDLGLETSVKIVHLSDLHSKPFGEDNKRLVNHVKDASPDMIFMTGDLVDQDDKALDGTLGYIGALTDIAPVFVISGNHEYWSSLRDEVRQAVEAQGAHWMDGHSTTVSVNGETMQIVGVHDPAGEADPKSSFAALVDDSLRTLVLSHRPLAFEWLQDYDVDLVFSGHVHGGMVRLPFIGGLYGPDQGFFPEYESGLYHASDAAMVVSRGLGNSVFPLRVFNRPDIVAITID